MANFGQEVLEASVSQIVIVDFWAPWCGPCKQLTPILERVVAQTSGSVKLVKVDIDKNPQIAQQMRIQSIPAVFAFFDHQPIDGFMGALPEPQIQTWLAELIKATGVKPLSNTPEDFTKALEQASELLATGETDTAQAIYRDILSEQPDNALAFAGNLRCLITKGEVEKAETLLDQASASLSTHKEMESIHSALSIAKQAQQTSGSIADLVADLYTNPNDHQARFDLALTYYVSQEMDKATDELLEIVKRDRKWQDDAARKQLVQIFEALGPMHPQTIEGRKKLSAILFA